MFISLIHAHYAIRVDTDVSAAAALADQKSESSDATIAADLPKAEALTLVIKKHVPLRPVKVIERKDDVVVIHTSKRSKRKQNSRRRRPSNQYRSKIKHSSSGSSSFGGFKDFTSGDSRFPPFSSSKPGRATNKYKFGPPKSKSSLPPVTSYEYNAPPPRRPTQPSRHSNSHGQSASSYNHIESHYAAQPVTLQQQQQQQSNNYPSFSFGSAEPPQANNYNFNNEGNKFNSQQSQNAFFGNEISKFPTISNFPLGGGSSFDIPKTSYGEPVRSASNIDTTSYQFNSNVVGALNNLNKVSSNKASGSGISNNFPKLPAKYETSDFSTPTRHNPLHSNSFTNDFTTFDLGVDKTTKAPNVPNRFNKFHNYDYDFRNHKTPLVSHIDDDDDDEDDEDLDYLYTTARPRPRPTTTTTTEFTTTTRKYKKGIFGKRKRPVKIEHNLDTDDLRDAFSDATNDDFHEVALNSDDFLNFDSQRNVKKNPISEFRTNLKLAKRNPALRSALGDEFQILSVQKSLEKDPSSADIFQRRRDEDFAQNFREFRVGGDLRFSEAAPVMWNGDMNNKPRNHRF